LTFLEENPIVVMFVGSLILLSLSLIPFILFYKFQDWFEMRYPRLYNKIGNTWTVILIVFLIVGFVISIYAMATGKVRISYSETGNIYT